jgi:CRP-like cAMP-binding protein
MLLGPRDIPSLEHLGGGAGWFHDQLTAMITETSMFGDFSPEEVSALAGFMEVYRVQANDVVIREADRGDYMVLLLDGSMEISKESSQHKEKVIAVVGPGKTLGEMSMIDGEPRFATCTAREITTFAVLTRDGLDQILREQPALGSRVLVQLVKLLSQRLRQISVRLVDLLT